MGEGCSGGDGFVFPDLQELHALWAEGGLLCEGKTLQGGAVRVLDVGSWNRGAGADFLQAEMVLDGRPLRGDLVLTERVQDWVEHGCAASELFCGVMLHLVLQPPPSDWVTRDVRGREVPVFCLPRERVQAVCGGVRASFPDESRRVAPLRDVPLNWLIAFLRSAAAYRLLRKRRFFRAMAERVGEQQAWFCSLAEALGYRLNKLPMRLLAQRAPLETLGKNPEALLFGTAGFLVPLLPEQSEEASRRYHRRLWDAWWPQQELFALRGRRVLPWRYAPLRPPNHPHRRVAALAVAAERWGELRSLLHARHAEQLVRFLTSLSHPYWDVHCSLPSEASSHRMALVGKERAHDFLINHVYVQEESEEAWRSYLTLTSRHVPSRVEHLAALLFGIREDVGKLLHSCFVQQALLQLEYDFGDIENSVSSPIQPPGAPVDSRSSTQTDVLPESFPDVLLCWQPGL